MPGSGINLGGEIEEGRKVDVELRNASGDAVAEKKHERRPPTGEAEDGGDRAEGHGGDSGGLSLADVESQRGSFSRAGTVEVDDANEETLDNKEKGIAPCAMDGD